MGIATDLLRPGVLANIAGAFSRKNENVTTTTSLPQTNEVEMQSLPDSMLEELFKPGNSDYIAQRKSGRWGLSVSGKEKLAEFFMKVEDGSQVDSLASGTNFIDPVKFRAAIANVGVYEPKTEDERRFKSLALKSLEMRYRNYEDAEVIAMLRDGEGSWGKTVEQMTAEVIETQSAKSGRKMNAKVARQAVERTMMPLAREFVKSGQDVATDGEGNFNGYLAMHVVERMSESLLGEAEKSGSVSSLTDYRAGLEKMIVQSVASKADSDVSDVATALAMEARSQKLAAKLDEIELHPYMAPASALAEDVRRKTLELSRGMSSEQIVKSVIRGDVLSDDQLTEDGVRKHLQSMADIEMRQITGETWKKHYDELADDKRAEMRLATAGQKLKYGDQLEAASHMYEYYRVSGMSHEDATLAVVAEGWVDGKDKLNFEAGTRKTDARYWENPYSKSIDRRKSLSRKSRRAWDNLTVGLDREVEVDELLSQSAPAKLRLEAMQKAKERGFSYEKQMSRRERKAWGKVENALGREVRLEEILTGDIQEIVGKYEASGMLPQAENWQSRLKNYWHERKANNLRNDLEKMRESLIGELAPLQKDLLQIESGEARASRASKVLFGMGLLRMLPVEGAGALELGGAVDDMIQEMRYDSWISGVSGETLIEIVGQDGVVTQTTLKDLNEGIGVTPTPGNVTVRVVGKGIEFEVSPTSTPESPDGEEQQIPIDGEDFAALAGLIEQKVREEIVDQELNATAAEILLEPLLKDVVEARQSRYEEMTSEEKEKFEEAVGKEWLHRDDVMVVWLIGKDATTDGDHHDVTQARADGIVGMVIDTSSNTVTMVSLNRTIRTPELNGASLNTATWVDSNGQMRSPEVLRQVLEAATGVPADMMVEMHMPAFEEILKAIAGGKKIDYVHAGPDMTGRAGSVAGQKFVNGETYQLTASEVLIMLRERKASGSDVTVREMRQMEYAKQILSGIAEPIMEGLRNDNKVEALKAVVDGALEAKETIARVERAVMQEEEGVGSTPGKQGIRTTSNFDHDIDGDGKSELWETMQRMVGRIVGNLTDARTLERLWNSRNHEAGVRPSFEQIVSVGTEVGARANEGSGNHELQLGKTEQKNKWNQPNGDSYFVVSGESQELFDKPQERIKYWQPLRDMFAKLIGN